jgi:hypothetical protein
MHDRAQASSLFATPTCVMPLIDMFAYHVKGSRAHTVGSTSFERNSE